MRLREKKIVVMGDRDFVNIFRSIGIRECYVVNVKEDKKAIKDTLLEVIKNKNIGLIILMEDLEDIVKDIIEEYKFQLMPLIVFLPSIKGSRIRDVSEYYTQLFKRTLGISVSLGGA